MRYSSYSFYTLKTLLSANYMKKSLSLLVLLLLLTCWHIHAENTINFYTINAKQGLSSNRIQSITKDRYGFMWFATRNGLYRYDGYQIHHYNTKKETNFLFVAVDASNTIWIKGKANWYYYEAEKDQLNDNISLRLKTIGIHEKIKELQIDSDKNLWCWSDKHTYYYNFANSHLPKIRNYHPIHD